MESAGLPGFEKGAAYTRRRIRELLGGNSRVSFPARGGQVVCVCLTPAMNPDAPREILVGGSPGVKSLARRLAAAGTPVPLFIKRRPREWECAGTWRVSALLDDPATVEAHAAGSGRQGVAIVLRMEEAPVPASPDVAAEER